METIVIPKLRREGAFQRLAKTEQKATFKRFEEELEDFYYTKLEESARRQIEHFEDRMRQLGPPTGAEAHAVENAAGNARAWRDIEEVAAAKRGHVPANHPDADMLGKEGPEVAGMHADNVEDVKTADAHDRRTNKATTGTGKRTPLADGIPPPGPRFNEFWDSLSEARLEQLLADEGGDGLRGAAQILAGNVRHPYKYHAWLMASVAEIRQFKRWGISMDTIKEARSLTAATIGKKFRHGKAGSGAFHDELRRMIKKNDSYEGFVQDLNHWADDNLVPSHSSVFPEAAPNGRYSLPGVLHRQQ